MDKKGITQAGLAEKVGRSVNSVWRWCSGSQEPDDKMKQSLASALGVSVAYLMGETHEIIERPNLRGAKEAALISFDMVDKRVSCGRGCRYNPEDLDFNVIGSRQIEDGEIAAMLSLYPSLKLFGVMTEGDSMEPEIYEGDIVLFGIDPNNWSVGNQVVVYYEDALFVKGIVSGGNGYFPVVLRSFNKEYSDIVVRKDQRFMIIGRVLRIIPASRSPKSMM